MGSARGLYTAGKPSSGAKDECVMTAAHTQSPPPKWAWLGFWILAAILAACVVGIALILDAYEKSVWDILHKVLGTADRAEIEYVWLPDSYTARVEPPPHSYAENVETLEDFYDWKGTPGGVLAIYEGRPTTREVPHDSTETVEVHSRDGYTLSKITMPSVFADETVIFYELLPDTNSVQYNAVFLIPGTGHGGALDVLGEPGPHDQEYYQDGMAQTLAKAGYATYVIELLSYGERAIYVGSACGKVERSLDCSPIAVLNKLTAFGIDIADVWTDETTQVLAYIESRPYTRDVAVGGLSLGGALASNQAIINGDVVDAVVMAGRITSQIHSPLATSEPDPNIVYRCDVTDIVATIAPMPAYTSVGTQEGSVILRWEAEEGYGASFLSEVYRLHNMSENYRNVVHDGGHVYHSETVLEFLNAHLGRAP